MSQQFDEQNDEYESAEFSSDWLFCSLDNELNIDWGINFGNSNRLMDASEDSVFPADSDDAYDEYDSSLLIHVED